MLTSFFEMLNYDFIVNALIAGLLISICASLVGTNLVLKKQSMIGDGLSHVAFGAMIIAITFGFAPLYFTIPVVILASYLILRINNSRNINNDAAIAILSSSALAIGAVINTLNPGKNIDINSYLFGSILAINQSDLIIIAITTIAVSLLYLVFYKQIFAITIDEKFAKSIGINTKIYGIILAAICSVVIVLGMRMLGALLISSLIIFPCISARHLTKSFRNTVITSVALAIISFLFGLTASYAFNLPSGASIVCANLICFIVCWVYNKLR